MAVDVGSMSGIIVTPQAIRNIFHIASIRGTVPRKNLFISEKSRLKAFEFAKDYVSKSLKFWKKTFFTNESKFKIFGSDGKKTMWRKPNIFL